MSSFLAGGVACSSSACRRYYGNGPLRRYISAFIQLAGRHPKKCIGSSMAKIGCNQALLLSTDVRNWTLFDIKNWPPGVKRCFPEVRSGRLVQVVRGRDPRAAQRPRRVRRSGAWEVPVYPPGQAPGHACAGRLCVITGAFSKPARRFSRSR
jgi:hypothetical protein